MGAFTLDRKNGNWTLSIQGDLTIQTAAEFRSAILKLLEKPAPLVLDATGCTGLDLAGMQLFCATHVSVSGKGVALTVIPPSGQFFQQRALEAGFRLDLKCTKKLKSSCLWSLSNEQEDPDRR